MRDDDDVIDDDDLDDQFWDLDDEELQRETVHTLKMIDQIAGIDLRPEFHLFHDGNCHRIGRCRPDDVFGIVGEWIHGQIKAKNGELFKRKIYLFRGGNLWVTLRNPRSEEVEVDGFGYMDILFDEVRSLLGEPDRSVVEDEPKRFRFTTGNVEGGNVK